MNRFSHTLLVCTLCTTTAFAQKPKHTTLEPRKPKKEKPSEARNYTSEFGIRGGAIGASELGFGGQVQWLYNFGKHMQMGPALELSVNGLRNNASYASIGVHCNAPYKVAKRGYIYPG